MFFATRRPAGVVPASSVPQVTFGKGGQMAIPTKDTQLVSYGANMSAVLTASPTTYLQTAAVATQVSASYTAYADAYSEMAEARGNGVRSAQQTTTTQDLKKSFLEL